VAVVGVEARQVFDLPPLRLLVREHRAERRRCGRGTATAAAFPDHVRAVACYGPGVRALVCYLLVHQHLPVDGAAQLLADVLGAGVATGTVTGWAGQNVIVQLDQPLGRFTSGELRCPPLILEPLAPE
jgi:transposase